MSTTEPDKSVSDKSLTSLIYLFYALSLVLGVTALVAIVMNYVKRDDVRGTWLESHFRWQIRTFWFALGWAVVVGVVSLPLTLVLVGFGTWVLGLIVLGLWAIYRVARGWLRLNAHQPMPA